jgi:hypothetical protein
MFKGFVIGYQYRPNTVMGLLHGTERKYSEPFSTKDAANHYASTLHKIGSVSYTCIMTTEQMEAEQALSMTLSETVVLGEK